MLSENLLSELNQIARGNFGHATSQLPCEFCEQTYTIGTLDDKKENDLVPRDNKKA